MDELTQWNDNLFSELELIKAPAHWGEMTGPFFHLQLPEHGPIGPFHAHELKEFTAHIELPSPTLIRDAKGIGGWINFYEHPFFQRRKPQVIDENNQSHEKNELFLILSEGNKSGPHKAHEIERMLQDKELLLTDHASNDDGHTWHKLFEFSSFDRRSLSQNPLPESPGWEIFKESNEETKATLHDKSQLEKETSALASLAFLENMKSGKAHVHNEHPSQRSEEHSDHGDHDNQEAHAKILELQQLSAQQRKAQDNDQAPSNLPRHATYALIGFFLLSSLFFFSDGDKSSTQLAKNPHSSSDAPTLEPVKQADKHNNYKATRSRAKRSPRQRRPASITTTNSFNEDNKRQLRDSAFADDYAQEEFQEDYNDSDYGYDNGDTPVQQDPVRSRLDKEIIDSQEDYFDEEERYDYDKNYNYEDEVPVDAPAIEASQVWDVNKGQGRLPAAEEGAYSEEAYQDDFRENEAQGFY